MKKIFSLVLMAAAALAVAGCDGDAIITPDLVAAAVPQFVPQAQNIDIIVPAVVEAGGGGGGGGGGGSSSGATHAPAHEPIHAPTKPHFKP
jgi:hypothetical protein